MERGWSGLPYYRISEHYQKFFSTKIYKIPVSVVDNCPNRMGLKGMKTCSFCDVWGSAANSDSFELSLPDQIKKYKELIGKKYNAKNFLVYFQAYTNTFSKLLKIKNNFETALEDSDIKGLVIGTRPDCLSEALFELWNEYAQKTYVGVELGVQSFFNPHLEYMRRGHSSEDSLRAIEKIASKTHVDLGIHLIFGSPNETRDEIIQTAKICNDLPITNVKLHNLHVLKNTPLEEWYLAGAFSPISFEEYRDRVGIFISHLHPRIAIHRLVAFAPRWDELIAPRWNSDKMGPHQKIVDYLRENKIFQGQNFNPRTDKETQLVQKFSSSVIKNSSI